MSGIFEKCARCGATVNPARACPYCIAEFGGSSAQGDNGGSGGGAAQAQHGAAANPAQTETLEDILSKSSSLRVPSGMAMLINRDTQERFPLAQSVSKIGRDKANNISLHNDSYVSRHHAWVLFIKGSYWVEDLGSTNGTLLNDELLSERKQIFPGDRIKIGRTDLTFEL